MNQLYSWVSADAPAPCPVCSHVLPCRGEVRGMTLRTQPSRVVQREGRDVETHGEVVETQCFMRICQCGLAIAVQPGENAFGYSFRCRVCDCFVASVSASGWCLACILEHGAGIKNPHALMETLRESSAPIGLTRSQFLDGFLKGVILGVPGLVVPDAA